MSKEKILNTGLFVTQWHGVPSTVAKGVCIVSEPPLLTFAWEHEYHKCGHVAER